MSTLVNTEDKQHEYRTLNELLVEFMQDKTVQEIILREMRGVEDKAKVVVKYLFPSGKTVELPMGFYPFGSIIPANEREL